ncbi:2666_t:CDS:2, partial [Cetraspora pellucida]
MAKTFNKKDKNIYFDDDLPNYEYLDPDNDYALLDEESITDSANEKFEPGTPNTNTTTTSENIDDNIITNENADENIVIPDNYLIQDYIQTMSNIEPENFTDIDWLSSELDDSESLLSNISTTDNDAIDYQIDDTTAGTNYSNKQCIITEIIDGKLERCSNSVARPLKQMMGIWELDFNTVDEVLKQSNHTSTLQFLGVCTSYFNFDQDGLHIRGSKSSTSIGKSMIHKRRCLFCYNRCYYFSRGDRCLFHSWSIMDRNICYPCCGVKVCPVFEKKQFIQLSTSSKRTRYTCSTCFENEGGHIFQRKGRGAVLFNCNNEHINDKAKSLELLGQWIFRIANSSDEIMQSILIEELWQTDETLNNKVNRTSDTKEYDKDDKTLKPPSYLAIKIALQLKKVHIKDDNFVITKIVQKDPKKFGEALAHILWNSRSFVRENKSDLENPNTLNSYRNAFPPVIKEFIDSLIISIQKKKWTIVERKQRQCQQLKDFDDKRALKISTFLISVILTVTFPNTNIWITHILSSLCQKPNMQSSLYAILCMANVVAHSARYERKIEKDRQICYDPKERLLKRENIFNIYVIDNLDIKQKQFSFDNIFDKPRQTAHVTLRIDFQYIFSKPLTEIIACSNYQYEEFRVGASLFVKEQLAKFNQII